jgi:hypothetical protein
MRQKIRKLSLEFFLNSSLNSSLAALTLADLETLAQRVLTAADWASLLGTNNHLVRSRRLR